MVHRRVTIGRSLALLIVGVVIGAALFVANRLRPDSLRAQVEQALAEWISTEFRLQAVGLDLDSGIELKGLTIYYSDGLPAVQAESIVLTLNHRKLLSAPPEVDIQQVDAYGLTVRLRPDRAGAPSLPGILRERERETRREPIRPVVRIHPGRGGSTIVLEDLKILGKGVAPRLGCAFVEAHPDGPGYHATALLKGPRLGAMKLDLSLDLEAETLRVGAEVRELRWARDDIYRLGEKLRKQLPPIEVSGEADLTAEGTFRLEPFDFHVSCRADVRDLAGAFGNLHTGERKGLPFGVDGGTAKIEYSNERFSMPDFKAAFISPEGVRGEVGVSVDIAFHEYGTDVDWVLRGRGVRASTEDLRLLLEPDVVDTIVGPYQPAGTFDLSVTVSRRPGLPEKVWAELDMSDGEFNYAGRLDELTGTRFGFHYPLDRCRGHISIETAIPSPHGRCERIVLDRLRGFKRNAPRESGPVEVAVSASGTVVTYLEPPEPETVDIVIQVTNLPIDAKLAAAFASTPRGMPYHAFDLTGWADSVRILIERDAFLDDVPRTTYEVELRDCAMAYEAFPLHIEGLRGTIVSEERPPDEHGTRWRVLRFVGLEGRARDGGVIRGSGWVRQRETGNEKMRIDIQASDLELGSDLVRALERTTDRSILDLWRKLRPHGRIQSSAIIRSARDAQIRLRLDGQAGVRGYDGVDCPVRELTGLIAYDAGRLTMRDLKGRVGGSPFLVEGELDRNGALNIRASVRDLVLDGAIRAIVKKIAPGTGTLLDRLREDSTLDVALRAKRRSSIFPIDFSAELTRLVLHTEVEGMALEVRGGRIEISDESYTGADLWLRSGDVTVHLLDATLPRELRRYGWVRVDATGLHPTRHLGRFLGGGFAEVLGDNVRIDLKGFRAEFNRGDGSVILSGAVDLRRFELLDKPPEVLEPTGHLGFSPLTLRLPERPGDPVRLSGVIGFHGLNMNLPLPIRDMSGELRMAEGTLADGLALKGAVFDATLTLFDRVFEKVSLNIRYDPHYLHLGNIDAVLYGGAFRGGVDVHLVKPGGFKVRLRATDVNLGEMLKEEMAGSSDPLEGTLDAAVELESASGEVQHMRGRGEIRVREGRLFEIPDLRAILSVLGRVAPLGDSPRFRRAEVDFAIRGELFDVSRIHLSTATNDVFSRGTISIYGDLDLTVEPQVTRILDLPRLINLPVLSTLRNLWHKAAYEIRLLGTIQNPALRLRAFPFLKSRRKPFTPSPHAGRARRIRPRILP